MPFVCELNVVCNYNLNPVLLMSLSIDVVHVGMIYPLSSPPSLDNDNLTLELMEYLLKCLTSQVTNTTCTCTCMYVCAPE